MKERVKLSGDPAYTYAVGRVRARERRLLTTRALTEAAEAKGFEAAVEALREGGYEKTAPSAAGVEELIARQSVELDRFLSESAPDEKLVAHLRLEADYANLKAALVGRLGGKRPSFTEGWSLPADRLASLAEGGEPDGLPEPFGALARELLEEWDKNADPFLLQQDVDRALFTRLGESARELKLPFLAAYQRLEIDLVNLVALARCLAAPEPGELAPAAFIPGGGLDVARLEGFARAGDRAGAAAYVGRTPYADFVPAVEAATETLGDLTAREAAKKLDFLRQARHAPFGPEPVIAYYLAKKNEFRLVRFVLTCKLAGVPPETITARLWGA
ncbi:MAG TPA: hypothetical protein ENN88_00065 [Candidatus Coatesbacteria bacterium]|nr:hypothetical protein [Candidatus Coatesbacteria bacterium]